MNRVELIKLLINHFSYTRYLEVGVFNGFCFNEIDIPVKVGVDPEPLLEEVIKKTSDEFFASNSDTFDIIFIDGLHLDEQVQKDVMNSLGVLSENGIIIIHDCNPPKREHQEERQIVPYWSGTVWRAWVKLRAKLGMQAYMFVIPQDTGLGVIKPCKEKLLRWELPSEHLTFDNLKAHRSEWLNFITKKEFHKWLKDVS